MKASFVGILLCCFCALNVSSQTKLIDSLKISVRQVEDDSVRGSQYLLLASSMRFRNSEQALLYLDTANSISTYVEKTKDIYRIEKVSAMIYDAKRSYDTALVFYEQSLEIEMKSKKDSNIVADTYYKLGNMHRRWNKSEEAIDYIQQSKEIYTALKIDDGLAQSDIVLGIIYKNAGQYEEALAYYKSAYDVFQAAGDNDAMATCILNKANILNRQNKYEEALDTYDEAYKLALKLEDNNEGLLAFIYANKVGPLTSLNRHKEALEFAEKSYEIRKDRARPNEKVNSLLQMSASNNKLGRHRTALRLLSEAQEITDKAAGMQESQERIYNAQYNAYKGLGDKSKALDALEKRMSVRDSIRNTELDKKVLELNEQLETERKEREIEMLSADKELAETKLSASRVQAYGLLGGLLLVSGLLFSVFRLNRKTQIQNGIISKALGEKEILLREIHHRVKNNLQFISSLLGLQTEHIEDESALGALREGQDRVQSMALIHQNLYQEDNLTGVDMQEYFVKLVRGLFDSYNIRKDEVDLRLEIEKVQLDVDTVIPIGLIVNELVSNSLKYAFPEERKGEILVQLSEHQGVLTVGVKDNGIGISKEALDSLGDSFGHRLIDVLKNQLRAEVRVENKEGAAFYLDIRKYEKV